MHYSVDMMQQTAAKWPRWDRWCHEHLLAKALLAWSGSPWSGIPSPQGHKEKSERIECSMVRLTPHLKPFAPSLSHFSVIEIILSLAKTKDPKSQNNALRIYSGISAHFSHQLRMKKNGMHTCDAHSVAPGLAELCSAFAHLSTETRSVVLKEGATGTRRSCGACGSKHRHGPVRVPEGLRTCTQDQAKVC